MILVRLRETDFNQRARLIKGNKFEGTLYKSPGDEEMIGECDLFEYLSIREIEYIELVTKDCEKTVLVF